MPTTYWKKTQKKKDGFDAVVGDTENTPQVTAECAKNVRIGKENIHPQRSSVQEPQATPSPLLFSFDMEEECSKKNVTTAKKGKKKAKKSAAANKKPEVQQKLQNCPDFDSIEKDDFYVEKQNGGGERQALHSLDNIPSKADGLKSDDKFRPCHLSLCTGAGFGTPDLQTVSNVSIKEEVKSCLKKENTVSNLTPRDRRLRPRKSVIHRRESNNSIISPVPGVSSQDLSSRSHSCSTPKSANHHHHHHHHHQPSYANTSLELDNWAVTPTSADKHSNTTHPSFELIRSGNSTSLVNDFSQLKLEENYLDSSADLFKNESCSGTHEGRESFGDSLDLTGEETAEQKVLHLCDQSKPIGFTDCISERMMSDCVKIGEGVYGEVFKSFSMDKQVALKIIPIEGGDLVNDCPQKRFDEILPEIVIARELSDLAVGETNRSSNFCQVNRVSCVKGAFPLPLLQQWDEYAKRKKSENDRPDFFSNEQLFIVFEFAHGGCALESFKFQSQSEVYSVLRQVVFALAVAEQELQFEHRDLHIGNVLVKKCVEETITFYVDDLIYEFRTEGVIATIIDFTISRLKKDGCAVFCDISTDEGLFEGTGDIQFDVYRDMRINNGNDWESYHPETNILWTSYLCTKLLTTNKPKNARRAERHMQQNLQKLSKEIPKYESCAELASTVELWAN
ncbi:serine/threonine-protein kinase haspin-like [Elysia marginata]|uniref:non-specific serine/threonine protein kinase n=1 Tax=Elysia marginata TaxID=1093978 RepID=A0AAV4GDL8_9GAST|nr:serine/threonine-protein kinase haspin-like [Elysia marginata]